jgi:hypothetical protein
MNLLEVQCILKEFLISRNNRRKAIETAIELIAIYTNIHRTYT